MKEKIIFEYNTEPTTFVAQPRQTEATTHINPAYCAPRDAMPVLPCASERDVARHFTLLSRQAYGVDNGIYPLGSCTMKYNPKINECTASHLAFTDVHPLCDNEMVQGLLEIICALERMLAEISGMDAVTLQPAAGAHGEYTGLLMIDAYHRYRGDTQRNIILAPKTSHGTNPASAALIGKQVKEIACDARGNIDLDALTQALNENVCALMLTNPTTLGLFEEHICEIARRVHKVGALLYYDGANLNPLLGIVRPGDMGFDVMHFNLHKTFATPHGGGGPGAGPVGVKEHLAPFLPVPRVSFDGKQYTTSMNAPQSIGQVRSFYGNIPAIIRAYTYICALGPDGLKRVGETAILNANYLLSKLKKIFYYPFGDRPCWHEFVVSAKPCMDKGVHALDIAKRMIDYGVHPPTIYFPLTVPEAMMFEPTETESKESIDELVNILESIADEIQHNPSLVTAAPACGRLDDVKAVKEQKVIWKS